MISFKRSFAALALLCSALFACPASSQTCNPATPWIESYGTFVIGSNAVFGPDCNHIIGGALGRTLILSPAVYYVDTTGSDGNNGLSPAAPFRTITHCIQVIYNTIDNQGFIPQCLMTGGQTFVESVTIQGAPVGVNCIKITGNSGNFVWEPQAGLSFIVEPSDHSCIIFTNITFNTTGGAGAPGTNMVFCHQANILDLQAITWIGNSLNDQGLFTDADCRANLSQGQTLGGTINNFINMGPLGNIQFSQGVTTTGTPAITQFIELLVNATAVFQGNFAVTGSYGAMRQYAVLNGAQLCNVGATIPGSAGITSSAGSANGFVSTANCGD